MANYSLSTILDKIRRICGIGNSYASDRLMLFIDTAYTQELPASFRALQLKDVYVFECKRNQEIYPFDQNRYLSPEAPCFVSKQPVVLYLEGKYNREVVMQTHTIGYGNGSPGPYNGIIPGTPIKKSLNSLSSVENYPDQITRNLLVTTDDDASQTVSDDGYGTLYDISSDNDAGSVNYETGDISVTFSQNVPEGSKIDVQYIPYKASKPLEISFYRNQFYLYPIPDKPYIIEITCTRTPSQALLDGGNPELNAMYEWIAFAAAKRFFEESMDMDGIQFCAAAAAERLSHMNTEAYTRVANIGITSGNVLR